MNSEYFKLIFLLIVFFFSFISINNAQITLGIINGTNEERDITIVANTQADYTGFGFSGLFVVLRYPAIFGPATPQNVRGFNQIPATLSHVNMGIHEGYQYLLVKNNTAAGPLSASWSAGNTCRLMSFDLEGIGKENGSIELVPDNDSFADQFINAYFSDSTAAAQLYGSDVILNGTPTVQSFSSTLSFPVASILSEREEPLIPLSQNNMRLYPNPVVLQQQLTVELNVTESSSQAKLLVYDAVGKQVHLQQVDVQKGLNRISVDTQNLAEGNFYIKLVGANLPSESLRFIRLKH